MFFPKEEEAGLFGMRASKNEIMEKVKKKGERRSPVAAALNKNKTLINDLYREIIFRTFHGAGGNV